MRATYTRTEGVRHLLAAYELGEDKLFGHVKPRKTRVRFLEFCRYLRSVSRPRCGSRSPATTSAHTSRPPATAGSGTGPPPARGDRLHAVERILVKPHRGTVHGPAALRYFALDGTDHASHKEQASMIRRYILWRNNHAYDERLRQIIDRANVA